MSAVNHDVHHGVDIAPHGGAGQCVRSQRWPSLRNGVRKVTATRHARLDVLLDGGRCRGKCSGDLENTIAGELLLLAREVHSKIQPAGG